MGIDIRIESTVDNEWNKAIGTNADCKWAWSEADIKWSSVFEFINFNPTLLYDNSPNFWTYEQLEVVLNNLIKLKTNPEYYACNGELYEIQVCESSTDKLIELFKLYVGKKCRMIIY